jgi:Fur family transcriptional regulator, ferric uptake regulator
MRDDLHTAVAERLRGGGQRYTSNRRALVEVLADADRPLTIPEVLAGRDVPQSSAYRNVALLEETGVLHRVTSTDEFARFELAEDITDHHHHHLICAACGDVADFTVSEHLESALEEAMREVADGSGFTPEHHRLDLLGRCRRCR